MMRLVSTEFYHASLNVDSKVDSYALLCPPGRAGA